MKVNYAEIVRIHCSSVFIPNMILSVSINIYFVPIINWAWTNIHSGLWHLRCHLVSGKLGVSYISRSSTAFTHPSCLPRCSLPLSSPPTITTTNRELDSKLESVPQQGAKISIREGCVATRKASSPRPLESIVSLSSFRFPPPSTYLNFLEVWKFWGKEKQPFLTKRSGVLL